MEESAGMEEQPAGLGEEHAGKRAAHRGAEEPLTLEAAARSYLVVRGPYQMLNAKYGIVNIDCLLLN